VVFSTLGAMDLTGVVMYVINFCFSGHLRSPCDYNIRKPPFGGKYLLILFSSFFCKDVLSIS
jgi:hypothetical protein